jgi:hypothetical protein
MSKRLLKFVLFPLSLYLFSCNQVNTSKKESVTMEDSTKFFNPYFAANTGLKAFLSLDDSGVSACNACNPIPHFKSFPSLRLKPKNGINVYMFLRDSLIAYQGNSTSFLFYDLKTKTFAVTDHDTVLAAEEIQFSPDSTGWKMRALKGPDELVRISELMSEYSITDSVFRIVRVPSLYLDFISVDKNKSVYLIYTGKKKDSWAGKRLMPLDIALDSLHAMATRLHK